MSRCGIRIIVIVAVLALQPISLYAQDSRSERVSFRTGTASATIRGSIRGYQYVDYVLGAIAGQTMSVVLKTNHGANYFNVLPPGSTAAIAIGANLGNSWSGTLPVDGDYTVRVYLMRSAARRSERAKYTLTIGLTGSADVKVPGTPYHATGMVACSVGSDPKGSVQCSFGVIRGAPGHAEVHIASPGYDVTLHRDNLRVLRFAGDSVTSPSAEERVRSEKQSDNWAISVNDFYFYIIPEAVISGG